MHVNIIETSSLGDRSYLVADRGVAAAIDPQRDIDRVLALARDHRVSITHVLETHIHNDYVTGGVELARTTGAEYVVAAADQLGYECFRVADGDIDNLTGAASSDIGTLADGTALQTYRVAEFADLTKILGTEGLTVLEVRQTNEYRTYHIHEALNIPLHELLGRLGEVSDGEVWAHCGSGYRASIAASIIEKPDRTVVLVDDAFDNVNPEDLATDP